MCMHRHCLTLLLRVYVAYPRFFCLSGLICDIAPCRMRMQFLLFIHTGLFRYAVIQSGSPLAFWAMSRPEWRPGYNINDCKNERDSCSVESNIPYKQYLKSLSTDVIKNIPGKVT